MKMMRNVNRLNEALLPTEKKNDIINNFVKFVCDRIGIVDDLPNVTISYDDKEAETMKSFGKYTPNDSKIRVVAINRNLADVLRTLAHELIHYKQNKEGRLEINSGETGSEIENEANAQAGVLMRDFAKENSDIFE